MDSRIKKTLNALYEDSQKNDPINRQAAANVTGRDAFYKAMSGVYMAVNPDFGHLLYTLVRTAKAKNIVEFGTSFGVSTIYLAAALRDNGGGRVITTEYHQEKVDRAKKNLMDAGLIEYVEFRVGDALETLKSNLPAEIDMIFLDGPKDLYLPVLQILEKNLRSGGTIASDNTDHQGLEFFLNYIRTFEKGYLSSPLTTNEGRSRGHEVTIKM